MSHILAIFLWAIAATGSSDTCAALAVASDADVTVCATPAPPPASESETRVDVSRHDPRTRRISNGF